MSYLFQVQKVKRKLKPNLLKWVSSGLKRNERQNMDSSIQIQEHTTSRRNNKAKNVCHSNSGWEGSSTKAADVYDDKITAVSIRVFYGHQYILTSANFISSEFSKIMDPRAISQGFSRIPYLLLCYTSETHTSNYT